MNSNEVNKIIAEYMELSIDINNEYVMERGVNGVVRCTDLYTDSLDALIPVWEKLRVMTNLVYGGSAIITGLGYSYGYGEVRDTCTEAAAFATAKAIKEQT